MANVVDLYGICERQCRSCRAFYKIEDRYVDENGDRIIVVTCSRHYKIKAYADSECLDFSPKPRMNYYKRSE